MWRVSFMPTDLELVFARVREAKAQSDANTTMLLRLLSIADEVIE